ncbi:MAG: hypothetical protein ACC656_03360 [Candidatus Heimdallarchaeota archaeon]
MKNIKLELFNFKKTLNMDQDDIYHIVDAHFNICDQVSEQKLVESLNHKLEIYKYDEGVKNLLEGLSNELSDYQLVYALRDLYKKVEKMDEGGMIYRHPMKVIMDIINEADDTERKARILNELTLYDYVLPIKKFMLNFTENPMQRANMSSEGGKAEKIYTLVERVESGHLTFVHDKWFMISEKTIEPTTLDRWFNDANKLRQMVRLQTACKIAEIYEYSVNFKFDENLVIGINISDGLITLNGEKANKETTLENIFNSPVIPFMKRDFYPVISETVNNIDKFVDLDIAIKIYNVTNPFLEAIAFNYKEKLYTYSVDRRYGNSFFEFASAVELVNEMQTELGYDLTYFFKNKFDKEVIAHKDLEDREQIVVEKIKEVEFNIDRLNVSGMLDLPEISTAKTELVNEKTKLNNELNTVKRLLSVSEKEQVLTH